MVTLLPDANRCELRPIKRENLNSVDFHLKQKNSRLCESEQILNKMIKSIQDVKINFFSKYSGITLFTIPSIKVVPEVNFYSLN